MSNLLNDLKFGIRTMAKDRSFSFVAILTLAIALGANTAIFSVVNGILLRRLPFADPDRLMKLQAQAKSGDVQQVFSFPNIDDIRTQSRSFETVGVYVGTASFVRVDEQQEPIMGSLVDAECLRLLGVRPQLGRLFTKDDDRDGAAPVVVITDPLWRRIYHSDPHIVGRGVQFGTKLRTIVGVMPPGFEFPMGGLQRQFLMPIHSEARPDDLSQRDIVFLHGYARLRRGVTRAQANAELQVISKRLDAQYPATNTGLRFSIVSMLDYIVRHVRPALLLLTGAVFAVLLIGCANVANLLLARAAGRRREIAIRAAVGATRGRIVAQLLIESVLLSLIAGACGLLLAAWGVDVLKALAPADIPLVADIHLNAKVLWYALGLSVLTGIIFGLAPALAASKPNLNETLKEGTRGSTEGRSRNRARNVLVTAAIALSLVMLAGAGLLLRSFLRVTDVDPGFDYRHTAYIEVSTRKDMYKEPAATAGFTKRVLEALRAIPGVTSVGAIDAMPLGPDENGYEFSIVGRPAAPIGHEPDAVTCVATPGFFRTLGIPIRKGREFNEHDTASSPHVMLINEAFARKWFPNQDPIGQRIRITDVPENQEREIVGVVGDVKLHELTDELQPVMYEAFEQQPVRHLYYAVRAPHAANLGPSLRAAVRSVDREQPVRLVRTMELQRDESLSGRRFNLVLLGLLSALAVILAAVGIYSVMSYTVTQRTSEIGIRMALGASTGDVFSLIVGNALRLVLIGVAIGVAVALAATRVMSSMMFGVGTNDPITFVGICTLIGGVALIASWLPARRAARVDPLVAIRYD